MPCDHNSVIPTIYVNHNHCPTPPSVTPPSRPPLTLPFSPTSNLLIYDTIEGPHISDITLKQCADLFSNNYGIWGQRPANTKGPKPGS
jgi:hypothetical protein